MPKANVNNIHIEYETFGDPSSKPIILISGIVDQMISWDEKFCKQLTNRGFYVIRFDNRDVGLSTKLEEAGVPDLAKIMKGEDIKVPYTLEDMAADTVGLLDALNIEKAHICGHSMGASIAQIIAIRHPSRVLSLISMSGSTGNPDLPMPKAEILMQLFLKPPPTERNALIEDLLKRRRIAYGSGFPFDEKRIRRNIIKSLDRGWSLSGYYRQLAATMVSGNRKPALASVKAPTLVIHGPEDSLVLVEGGKDTAEAIPGSELLIIDAMGHMIPPEVWSQIFDAITANAEKVLNTEPI